jgi:uncharacterized Zn-binding protein involved in type VI secretion
VGDKANVPSDSHGCTSCAHNCTGPATAGSPDVYVNGRYALRVTDPGVHSSCCGPNTWQASAGSATVYFNGLKAHRKGDATQHCGGVGKLIEGSDNVFVGDGTGTIPPPIEFFDGRFQLFCEVTGVVLSGVRYHIKTASGRIVHGTADENGFTSLVETEGIENLDIEVDEPEGGCNCG